MKTEIKWEIKKKKKMKGKERKGKEKKSKVFNKFNDMSSIRNEWKTFDLRHNITQRLFFYGVTQQIPKGDGRGEV